MPTLNDDTKTKIIEQANIIRAGQSAHQIQAAAVAILDLLDAGPAAAEREKAKIDAANAKAEEDRVAAEKAAEDARAKAEADRIKAASAPAPMFRPAPDTRPMPQAPDTRPPRAGPSPQTEAPPVE